MTQEEKIDYMKMATNLCGFGLERKHIDLLVSLYELILEKEGDGSLMDVCKIESEVKNRDDVKRKQDLLDKVSNKIG